MLPQELLKKEGIFLSGVISLEGLSLRLPRLLTVAGFDTAHPESIFAVLFALPYLVPLPAGQKTNLSAYARGKDYHLFCRDLFDRILPPLRAAHPHRRFAGFADHSPLYEADAACRAGLGVLGENGLLITEPYSSYVFIGEIVTDLPLAETRREIRRCEGCGRCRRACPMQQSGGICRSALTQKKGELSPAEEELLRAHPLAWGCDVCSAVCPHTEAALRAGTLYSPLPFFGEDYLPLLCVAALDAMPEEAFAQRSYAWRGRAVVARNLRLQSKNENEE